LTSVLFEEGIFYKLERFGQNSYKIKSLFLISYQTYHFFRDNVYSFGLHVFSRYRFKIILLPSNLRRNGYTAGSFRTGKIVGAWI